MDPLNGLITARDQVEDPAISALLQHHLELMQASSPAESCHVQSAEALLDRGAILYSVREAGIVLGVGALTIIGVGHGELKSMHTAAKARRRGVARVILAALTSEAQAMGLHRLSLETGSADLFAPARALYKAHGFVECPPFGDYVEDPHSVFMTRKL